MSVSSKSQAPRHPEPAANEAESTAIAAEVADLLGRAVRHDQPLFLIVIYEHEGDKLRLLEVLRRRLLEEGYTTQTLDPRHRPEHGLGRFYAALAEGGPRALSLVSDLPRKTGGAALEPAFLEYFNLHRDRIARDRLRFLLFLHVVEMEDFVRVAGDMWDFRHRTYWLERPADPRGAGLWQTMAERGAALPLPAAERELIDRHLAGVRAVLDGATDPEIKARLLLDLCRWLTRRNAAGLAAEAALEGLSQLEDARTKLRAELEGALGYVLDKSSQLPEALRHYEQGLAVCREIGDRAGEAMTLNYICRIYHAWGRYEEALKTLEKSLAIQREIGDRAGEAATLNNISPIYHAWGRYEEALKTLEKSLAIAQEVGDRAGEAATLNNISSIYNAWGRYEEALKTLEKSLAIYREIGGRVGEAATLNNISQIYHAWGRYEEALKTLEKSLAISQEVGNRAGEAVTSWNLVLEYERRGDLARALPLLESSVRIKEALKHPDLERDQAYLAALKNRMREPGAEPSSSAVDPMIPRSDPK